MQQVIENNRSTMSNDQAPLSSSSEGDESSSEGMDSCVEEASGPRATVTAAAQVRERQAQLREQHRRARRGRSDGALAAPSLEDQSERRANPHRALPPKVASIAAAAAPSGSLSLTQDCHSSQSPQRALTQSISPLLASGQTTPSYALAHDLSAADGSSPTPATVYSRDRSADIAHQAEARPIVVPSPGRPWPEE